MLSQLFQDSDYILYQGSGSDKRPQGSFIMDASDNPFDSITFVYPVYFSINPIDPYNNRNDKGAGTPRASINVTAFRNFLFEIDSLPLDVQLGLLRHLAPHIPLAQVTFSGGSSYHAIVSVADTLPFKPHTLEGIAQYSQAWRALNAELTELASAYLGTNCPARLFDPACKDPSRLSRTPGAIRPDTGNTQTEIDGFGGYVSADQVLQLMQKHRLSEPSLAPKVSQAPDMDLQLLKLRLLYAENRGLRSKIQSVSDWASTEYMYPELFQLTLWLIDSVGAPLNATLELMRLEIFPTIKAAGYPRNPELAVYNAYIWKGLM